MVMSCQGTHNIEIRTNGTQNDSCLSNLHFRVSTITTGGTIANNQPLPFVRTAREKKTPNRMLSRHRSESTYRAKKITLQKHISVKSDSAISSSLYICTSGKQTVSKPAKKPSFDPNQRRASMNTAYASIAVVQAISRRTDTLVAENNSIQNACTI